MRALELTDLLWVCDPGTMERLPVSRDDVVDRLAAGGQRRAAMIARRLPATGGVLDEPAIDALLLRVHRELQRLGEELQQPRRVAETIAPWVDRLVARHPGQRVRIVDVGCGLGYVTRWFSQRHTFGDGVELLGVDLNATLIAGAETLARAEGLRCRFVVGNAATRGVAIEPTQPTVVISTGLLHHLQEPELEAFFREQADLNVDAFAHWDVDPSPWSTLGAWVFHRARMREAVSRHDGVLSARRAHRATTLLRTSRTLAGGYLLACRDAPLGRPRLTNALRPVTGVRVPS